MNDVFISYSRRDKAFTQKLYEVLKGANRTVWADWDSIPAASDWFAEIREGIEQTESVLFVLSPEWIKSNECRKELSYAVEVGKRLIPIIWQPVNPNDVPPELAKINWVYMREGDDFEKAFQTLCSAMDTDLTWVKTHTRIQVRAMEWDQKKRDHSFVLRGKDLSDAEQFLSQAAAKSPEPTSLQGEYILASRKDASRRQRLTMTGVTIALIVSVALGVVAFFQRQAAVAAEATAISERDRAVSAEATAVAERDRADLNAEVSFSRELTAGSLNYLNIDPELSILLTLQAIDVTNGAGQPVLPSTDEALRAALQSSRLRHVIPGNKADSVYGLSFSPDGNLMATGSWNGNTTVWKISHSPAPLIDSGIFAGTIWTEKAFTLPKSTDPVYSIAFSPDGLQMATSASSSPLTPAVWDTTTGKQLFSFSGHTSTIRQVAFSPDGKLLATGSADGTVRVWDLSNGKEALTISDHNAPVDESHSIAVRALAFSPDGNYLASGGEDGILIISDAHTGANVYTYQNFYKILGLAFSPDGKSLAWGDDSYIVKSLDLATKELMFEMKHHKHQISAVAYSPNGNLLASSANDGKVIVSNAHDGSDVFVLSGDKDFHISNVAFSPDGKYIASVNGDGQTKFWDASPIPTPEAGDLFAHTKSITGLDYSQDGKYLATSNQDIAYIWQFPLETKQKISLSPTEFLDIVFSPDGKSVATGSLWAGASIWDSSNGNKLLTVRDTESIVKVEFSPDGKMLGGGLDMAETAILWNVKTGKQLNEMTINGPTNYGTNDVDFSLDGKLFAAAYSENATQILDVVKDTSSVLTRDHGDWVLSVAISPDGKLLLTGGADGIAVLRDIAANKKLFTFSGQGPINDVAFTPDGTRIATASLDGTIKVWDTKTGALLFTLSPSAGSVNNIAFSPDGKILATGSEDGVIRFYYMNLEDVIALAKSRITRSLTGEECKTFLREKKCPETIVNPQAQPERPANAISLQPQAPVTEVVRSGDGQTLVSLEFVNNSTKTLKLYWITGDGNEQFFDNLAPSVRYVQGTYNTHAWRVRDEDGNLVLEYVVTEQATQVIEIGSDLKVTLP